MFNEKLTADTIPESRPCMKSSFPVSKQERGEDNGNCK
jgi:hypothetical protein